MEKEYDIKELKKQLIKSLIEKLQTGGYVTETEFCLLKFLDNKKN